MVLGEKSGSYRWGFKVAVVRDVVECGELKANVMVRYAIALLSPLEKRCEAYREGSAEALGPRPKGRPKGAKAAPRETTREWKLERRICKLVARAPF